jgi:hypothetical protein
MAALTGTRVTYREPVGSKFMVTVRVTALGDNAADEYIPAATWGLSYIDSIVGWTPVGTAPWANVPLFNKNGQGTGATEGDNPGDVGIEVEAATDNIMEVTVLGRR